MSLGPEWQRGEDGLLFRRAARVILLDAADRVLLVRGHDVDQPERSWWFTVGGGIDPGEDSRAAAVRELREESGIVLSVDALVGPVFTRSAIFDFYAEHCRQDEELFLARLPGTGARSAAGHSAVGSMAVTSAAAADGFDRTGWTDVERDVLDELRWWHLDDLAALDLEVFPEGLPDLVRPLLSGWDGTTRHLGLARE